MADLLWPFAAHGPATEVLDWRTDVLQSEAAEQRLSLRDSPREVLTLRHRLDGPGFAEALALARRGLAGNWIVPLWHMADRSVDDIASGDTSLTITARPADYRAPGFAVAASNGGVAHLLSVAAVHPDGIELTSAAGVALTHPVIAPARRARLLAPLEIERRHADLGFVTARFLLQESADLSGLRGTALYIAVDTSTSMSGAKITAAMAAVRALVDELAGSKDQPAENGFAPGEFSLDWLARLKDEILPARDDAGDISNCEHRLRNRERGGRSCRFLLPLWRKACQ